MIFKEICVYEIAQSNGKDFTVHVEGINVVTYLASGDNYSSVELHKDF